MQQKLRILLVEDQSYIYRDVQRFLESKGHEVVRHPAKRFIDNYEDAVEMLADPLPDLAILDIEIQGSKSGLELGEFISDTFWIPIIYLTKNIDVENRTTAGQQEAKGFIAKVGKPLNKLQLELDIDRVRPIASRLAKRRTLGDFFSVCLFHPLTKEKSGTPVRKKIDWEQILYITTANALKNNVLFHLADGTQWLLHEPLSELQKRLPPFLVPYNNYETVNIKHVDRASKSAFVYYLKGEIPTKEEGFKISDNYRDAALPLIRLFFPSL